MRTFHIYAVIPHPLERVWGLIGRMLDPLARRIVARTMRHNAAALTALLDREAASVASVLSQ